MVVIPGAKHIRKFGLFLTLLTGLDRSCPTTAALLKLSPIVGEDFNEVAGLKALFVSSDVEAECCAED